MFDDENVRAINRLAEVVWRWQAYEPLDFESRSMSEATSAYMQAIFKFRAHMLRNLNKEVPAPIQAPPFIATNDSI